MRDLIINLQNSDTWKIQLTIAINFISSKDAKEECVMHSKGKIMKLTSYNDVNKIVDDLFDPLCLTYQDNLETSMREKDFIFDSVHLIYCKCHEVNLRRDGSYIDSPDWLKKKKAIIDHKNKDDKCFQHAVTVELNCAEIESHAENVSNINVSINK